LAIGGLNGFVSTEVENSTSVIRLNGSAKIPPIANARHVACKLGHDNLLTISKWK